MPTLVVYGKGDLVYRKLYSLITSKQFSDRSYITIRKPRWFQYQPRIEARFHYLTAEEISRLKVKLSLIPDIRKIDLI